MGLHGGGKTVASYIGYQPGGQGTLAHHIAYQHLNGFDFLGPGNPGMDPRTLSPRVNFYSFRRDSIQLGSFPGSWEPHCVSWVLSARFWSDRRKCVFWIIDALYWGATLDQEKACLARWDIWFRCFYVLSGDRFVGCGSRIERGVRVACWRIELVMSRAWSHRRST